MAAGSGSSLGLTSTALSVRRANFSGVTGLPFPLAYTTAAGSVGNENVWVAGNGRQPTRVGPTMEFPPSLDWSANGRYLVTVVDAYSYSSSVERYDDVTGDIRTWPCGGCEGAVVVGNGIVAVSSKLQLLLFPLGGGRVEPPRSITGMPQWSRSSLPHSIPVAVGGTGSAVLLAWPIGDGASNVWGTYVLVALDGRYLRTVVGPGKSKQGVSLTDDELTDGVEMAPSTASALVSESYEISACEEGGNLTRLSLTTPGNITYPNPPEAKGTDADPISFAIDSAGSSWAVFTSTKWSSPPVTCDRSPARLYRWDGKRWVMKGNDLLGMAFGPRDQMVVIQGQLPSSGPAQWSGTLVVDEAGHHVDVASDVTAVTVPS